MNRSRYLIRSLAAAAAVATFLLYIPALRNDFINWDDGPYVFANPHIRSFDGHFFKWAFFQFHSFNWHPLTWISHALDYALWGLNPLGHHLTNIILHSVNTFLVVMLVFRLLDAYREVSGQNGQSLLWHDRSLLAAAGITGLLFGLHPLHVESVAWVAERKDLLCALFFLLSVNAYVNVAIGQWSAANGIPLSKTGLNHSAFRTRVYVSKHYLAALGFFILALMSKPMAVSLPAVLLILDWHPFNRIGSFRTLWAASIEKLPFLAFSLFSIIVTGLAQKSGGAMELMEFIPVSTRVLVALHSLIAYLGKMLWPLNLMPYYPYPRNVSLLMPQYLGAAALATAVAIACLREARKKQNFWLSVWLYYLVTVAPVLGLIQVGAQAMADRYTYLPSLGPFLLPGLGAAWVWARIEQARMGKLPAKVAGAALASLAVISLSLITVRQIGHWKNDVDLWQSVIDREGHKVLFAYFKRGEAFGRRGEYEKAIEDYSTVIEMNAEEYSKVYVQRGLTYHKLGREDLAIDDLKKACSLGDNFGCQALLSIGKKAP